MISADKLHTLILHLSSSEKGYIKKHLKLNPSVNKKSLLAFDVLEKQKDFNEEQFKQKTAFKDLSLVLEHLYRSLLACLEGYHKSEEKEIRSALNQIEILIEKNLFSQAEKLITKIKNITDKKSYYTLYSEVMEWEISLLSKAPPGEELQKKLDQIFERLVADIDKEEQKISHEL